MLGRILLSCIEVFPAHLRDRVYQYFKGFAEYNEGINNPDIKTNGELRALRQYIPNCHIVFDVGAHLGEWAQLVLKFNPKVELHCFEPSAPTFKKLSSRSFPTNVICNHFGLSSSNREAELKIFSETNGMNSLYQREGIQDRGFLPQKKVETVLLRTLDDYCHEKNIQKIDYLKLDVEGHELEVLRGSEKMLKENRIGIIQFEYGGCNIDSRVLLKDLFDFFNTLPYKIYKILPKSLKFFPRYSQQFENFQYSNWLAIRLENC